MKKKKANTWNGENSEGSKIIKMNFILNSVGISI